MSVLRIGVIALFVLLCASWVGFAALYLFVLKREGAAWSSLTRLWIRLKVAEYGLLLSIVVVALADIGPTWVRVVMVISLVALWIARWRIRRRAERLPGRINEP